ncbi:alpha/beta fold hydrolase [Rhodanobacter sp. B2A1Ga4]|uniref:alpha/beta hydrolase n=1 Tax=Rhodanobacter TaxID=75309 RepID=UPI000D38146E|nr:MULTISPECIES: alpha/beta hydrolase [Rhodanobacter]MBQ4854921.1 alpha/beta fold hydrolase [Rhodanobacter sp. B2A1Ga4]
MGVVVAIAVAIFAASHGGHRRGQDKDLPPAAAASPAPAAKVAPAKPATWKLGAVTLSACELAQPNSGLSTAAWCTEFPVPENRADPHSRTIRLKLAVLRSRAQVASPDMLAFLAGGPGQAATDSAGLVASVLQPLLAHRHVLLLDQRGTGGSNALDCKASSAVATPGDDSTFDADKLRAAAATCLKQLAGHADPRYYTTTITAQDLEDVRKALGAPPLDLVGVSYGTRMAQQYLMRFPQAVRSVVLDSVVPNSLALGEDFARNLDDALKAQFARCTAEPACKKQFGDPDQTLYQLRDALRANPHQVSFRDPQSYQTVKRMLDEDSLASVVRMFAYTPATAALLPLSIDAAARGDVGPLLGQAKLLSGELSELMGSGMQYSVICSEDADLLTARPQDAQTILGTRMVDALKAVCSVWPKGVRPADFHQPLKSDKPVLLLAGQYDPVTPPRYADEVAKGLPNARVLVLKGQAHSVMATGCTPQLIEHFVEKLDPKTLDASCLDRLQPTPIFIDFNGSTP